MRARGVGDADRLNRRLVAQTSSARRKFRAIRDLLPETQVPPNTSHRFHPESSSSRGNSMPKPPPRQAQSRSFENRRSDARSLSIFQVSRNLPKFFKGISGSNKSIEVTKIIWRIDICIFQLFDDFTFVASDITVFTSFDY